MHISSGVLEWTFNRSRQSRYTSVFNPMFNDVMLVAHTQPLPHIGKLAMLCIRDSFPLESCLLNVYQHPSPYKLKVLISDSSDEFYVLNKKKKSTDNLI